MGLRQAAEALQRLAENTEELMDSLNQTVELAQGISKVIENLAEQAWKRVDELESSEDENED